MRVVDRQQIPALVVDFAQCLEQFMRLAVVAHARVRVVVSQRVDLARASTFPADNATGLIRRIGFCLSHELF
jgi:hypothetical protein